MKLWKKLFLFCLGGTAYMGLELLWRGWSHGSMFLAGGCAFLLLGKLQQLAPPLPIRAAMGAGIITLVEYAAGLLFNRQYTVWDYRGQPLNLHGQICLPFTLLWVPVALGAMALYGLIEKSCPEEAGKASGS